jgi:hypothetical protein
MEVIPHQKLPPVWHTERRKLADLIPHSKNPRIPIERGVESLAGSLHRNGYIDTIAINLDNTILSGHRSDGASMNYVLNRDLFQPDILYLEAQGKTDECWTHRNLCSVMENAVTEIGKPARHRAFKDGRMVGTSDPGECLKAFCNRLYLQLTKVENSLELF